MSFLILPLLLLLKYDNYYKKWFYTQTVASSIDDLTRGRQINIKGTRQSYLGLEQLPTCCQFSSISTSFLLYASAPKRNLLLHGLGLIFVMSDATNSIVWFLIRIIFRIKNSISYAQQVMKQDSKFNFYSDSMQPMPICIKFSMYVCNLPVMITFITKMPYNYFTRKQCI